MIRSTIWRLDLLSFGVFFNEHILTENQAICQELFPNN